MNARPLKKAATYEDILALPAHLTGQILDGELYALPRPRFEHSVAASALGSDLNSRFGRGGGPGGWWILHEPEIHLGRDVVVPDIGGWRRERMPALPSEAYSRLAPDFVCEVLSPSTARIDRMKKANIFAREGVGHLWLVDPAACLLEVYRRQDATWVRIGVFSDESAARIEPYHDVELDVASWWPPAPEDSTESPR